MMAWFADTSYFIALLNTQDESHEPAVSFARATRTPLITTTLVIVELGNYLSHPRSRAVFTTFLADFRERYPSRIISVTDELLQQAIELNTARRDKEWSLTDCASFVVMKQNGISEALTTDHHFEQAGFVALLK